MLNTFRARVKFTCHQFLTLGKWTGALHMSFVSRVCQSVQIGLSPWWRSSARRCSVHGECLCQSVARGSTRAGYPLSPSWSKSKPIHMISVGSQVSFLIGKLLKQSRSHLTSIYWRLSWTDQRSLSMAVHHRCHEVGCNLVSEEVL